MFFHLHMKMTAPDANHSYCFPYLHVHTAEHTLCTGQCHELLREVLEHDNIEIPLETSKVVPWLPSVSVMHYLH